MNPWESIFAQSPVNRGCYEEKDLPQLSWEWPTATWFQTRLEYVREQEPVRRITFCRKPDRRTEQPTA